MSTFITCPECNGKEGGCSYCIGSGHIPEGTHLRRQIEAANCVVLEDDPSRIFGYQKSPK